MMMMMMMMMMVVVMMMMMMVVVVMMMMMVTSYCEQMTEGEESLNMVPEVIQVTLTKVRNSLGLSIVAAQVN